MAAEANIDIDFWEFVSCAKCHLPFASEPGKSIPFWLTECGHVICNNHLNPDQSCISCDATGILLVPLQQELDTPMSDWFRSIPSALDLIAFAAKFQQEVMARQIRFYRSRHQQIRTVIEKLRSENSELKRTNNMLAQENEQLRRQVGFQDYRTEDGHEPSTSTVINQNGKRFLDPSAYQQDYPSNRPRTGSSPLQNSVTIARLTLPVGQRTPELTRSKGSAQHTVQVQQAQSSHHHTSQAFSRPMSRQIGKFAYIPPETPQAPAASLSHTQMAPKLVRPSQMNQSKSGETAGAGSQLQAAQARNTVQRHGFGQQKRVGDMGPPPVPQPRLAAPSVPAGGVGHSGTSSRRFVPPLGTPRHQPQPSTSHGPQRFFSKAGNDASGTSASWSNSGGSSRVAYG